MVTKTVKEEVKVKDKILGGKEIEHTSEEVHENPLTGKKKVEKTVSEEKI